MSNIETPKNLDVTARLLDPPWKAKLEKPNADVEKYRLIESKNSLLNAYGESDDPIALLEAWLNENAFSPSMAYAPIHKIVVKDAWFKQLSPLTFPKGRWIIEGDGETVFYQSSGVANSFIDFNLPTTDTIYLILRNLHFRRASACTGDRNGLKYDQGNTKLLELGLENISMLSHQSSVTTRSAGASTSAPPVANSVGIDIYEMGGHGRKSYWKNVTLGGFDWAAKLHIQHLLWKGGILTQHNSGGLWLSPDGIANYITNIQGFHQGGYFVKGAQHTAETINTDCYLDDAWHLYDLWCEVNPTVTMRTNGWNDFIAMLRLEQGAIIELKSFMKDYQLRTFPTLSKSLTASPNDRAALLLDEHSHFMPLVYQWNSYTSGHVHETRFIARVPSGTVLAAGDNAQVMRHTYCRFLNDKATGVDTKVQVLCHPLNYPSGDIKMVWGEDYGGITAYTIRLHVNCTAGVTLASDFDILVELKMGCGA